jgi:4-carboxymuconolactone decarboxylase
VFDVDSYLLRETTLLDAQVRELAILATAREYDCPYVWSGHIPLARKCGIDEDAIRAIRDRGGETLLPAQRDVLDFVRQALVEHMVSQELFDRLRNEHNVPWLVELAALIGHCGLISTVLNAFEVGPPVDAETLLPS